MRLNRGVVLSLLVVVGAGAGCKKKTEIKSRPLVCKEAQGGEGAWSIVILPDEIRGLSGALVPQDFHSNSETFGVYNRGLLVTLDVDSWMWRGLETQRTDTSYDLTYTGRGALTDHYLLFDGVYQTYESRIPNYVRRTDLLSRTSGEWQELGLTELLERNANSPLWTGHEFLFWGGTKRDEDEGMTFLFDGFAYEPTASKWRKVEGPRQTLKIDDDDLRWRTTGTYAAVWTGSGMFTWQFLPDDLKVVSYYYSPGDGSWRAASQTNAPRARAAFKLISDLDNSVYLIGGVSPQTDDYIYLREVWRYTISTDSWDEIKVPEWVDPLDGVWMEGKLYVFGQCAAGASYDPKSDSWAQLPPGNLPSTGKVYTAGGRIMIGQVELHPSPLPYVWIYDPSGEQAPADAGQSIGWGGSGP